MTTTHHDPVKLLTKWAERELAKTHARGIPLPEIAYRWGVNPIGGFQVLSEGVCLERATRPHEHDLVDEFGYCLRSLDELDQALIIIGQFGDEDEWRKMLDSQRLSPRRSRLRLRLAWLRLLGNWIKREREWLRTSSSRGGTQSGACCG